MQEVSANNARIMTDLKGGITGSGMMMEYHLRAFSDLEGVSIKACSREYYGDHFQQQDQKQRFSIKAGKYGLKVYDGYEQMLEDEELDFIIVASINPYHEHHIVQALEYGKHVLAEKPVVTNLIGLKKVIDKATACKRLVFPSHNFVYRPATRKAKEILESGSLGTLIYASFISCFRSNDEHANGWRASSELSAGGALMDSGYHQIYQSLFLLGEPDCIQCFQSKQVQKQMEVEDFAMINAIYRDGCIVNLGQGHSSEFGDVVSGIRIVGEKGNIVITDGCYWNGEKVEDDADYVSSFTHQALYFVDCLRNNNLPLSNLDASESTLKIILAAYDSAAKSEIVKIKSGRSNFGSKKEGLI